MYGSFDIWTELSSSLLFREKLLKKCYDTYLLLDEEQFGYFEAEKVDRDSQLRFKYDVPEDMLHLALMGNDTVEVIQPVDWEDTDLQWIY